MDDVFHALASCRNRDIRPMKVLLFLFNIWCSQPHYSAAGELVIFICPSCVFKHMPPSNWVAGSADEDCVQTERHTFFVVAMSMHFRVSLQGILRFIGTKN
jgi:hypothetical protein